MVNFVYLNEFNDISGTPDVTVVEELDNISKSVLSTTFSEIPADNIIHPASTLTSDLLISKDGEITVKFTAAHCSLQNTLLAFTYKESYPRCIADIEGDVFVVMPYAHGKSIQPGSHFKLPASYETVEYKDHKAVSNVQSYLLERGTCVGFVLVAPFFDYIKHRDNIDDCHKQDSVKFIHSDFYRNKGKNIDSKSQTKIIQKTPTRFFIGFEDIPLDDPECDHDFNDLVIEVECDQPNSVRYETSTGTTSVLIQSSFVLEANGVCEKVQNQYVNANNILTAGGPRPTFGKENMFMLWSNVSHSWVCFDREKKETVHDLTIHDSVPPRYYTDDILTFIYQPDPYVVKGIAVDAATGLSVSGTDLIVTENSVIMHSDRTDVNGSYEVTYDKNLVTPDTKLVGSHHGYDDGYQLIASPSSRMALPPRLLNDRIQLVLTWGAEDNDLDIRVKTATAHCFYGINNQSVMSNGSKISLELDDESSFGPEMITILNPTEELYRIYVFNWSFTDETTFQNSSEVKISIYMDGAFKTIVPLEQAKDLESNNIFWHVADIVNKEIVIKNALVRVEPQV